MHNQSCICPNFRQFSSFTFLYSFPPNDLLNCSYLLRWLPWFGFLSIPLKSAKYEKSTFSLQGLKFRKRPPVRCNSVCKMVGCQIQYWQLRRCWVPLMRLEWPDYIKRLPVVAVDPGLQKRKTSTNGFRLTLGSRQQLHGLTPRVDKMAHSGWRNTHLDTAMMGLTLRSTNPKDTQRFVVPIEGL